MGQRDWENAVGSLIEDGKNQEVWYIRNRGGDSLLYFFFQAEDGIRDGTVTGVQTCALPIWSSPSGQRLPGFLVGEGRFCLSRSVPARSEERRVGKECRSRWSAYH